MKPDAYGIQRRNERINGKKNRESLRFVDWVKRATRAELEAERTRTFERWQRIAIERELKRREEQPT